MTRSRNGKIRRLEGTIGGIFPVKVSHDEEGNFMYYCAFGIHYGVVHPEKVEHCLEQGCFHLKKYREEK